MPSSLEAKDLIRKWVVKMKIKFFEDDMSGDLDNFVSKHNVIDIKIICDIYTEYSDDAEHNQIKTHIRYLVLYK